MPSYMSLSTALESLIDNILFVLLRLIAWILSPLKKTSHDGTKEAVGPPEAPTERTALRASSPQTPVDKPIQPAYTTITIPDMFQSFVSHNPTRNVNYDEVKKDSEEWIGRECSFSPRMRAKITRCDFSFFISVAAPLAPLARFRTLCDWGNWVFPYDDMFDNGELKNLPEESKTMMDALMAPMLGQYFDKNNRLPILRVHDTVVHRMAQKTRPTVQKRFAVAMGKYCRGALVQVEDQVAGRTPTLEEMVLIRRESAGVYPLYHLVEYAHDMDVPEEAFDDPLIQELESLGSDLVSISNDILSYKKEEREDVRHNMVAICRINGMSAQRAFDEVSKLLSNTYQRWDTVEAKLAKSKFAGNEQVANYVHGIKCVVQANISWSFRSERYLGLHGNQIRVSRRLEVLADPPFLNTDTRA